MKKITKLMAGLFAAGMFFSCSGSDGPDTPSVPADAIRNWTEDSDADEWKIYNYQDIDRLSKLVNDEGITFEDCTITVMNDIVINRSVFTDDGEMPAEGPDATPAPGLINLDSIGKRGKPFKGTFDGNGKIISGYYSYQAHQGLGFFGSLTGATVKNVIIKDACVINNNKSGATDGSDDDRFGGLVGILEGKSSTIMNCIFTGMVGSPEAKARGGAYEYIGGLVGAAHKDDSGFAAGKESLAVNCLVYAQTTTSKPICDKNPERLRTYLVEGEDYGSYDEDTFNEKVEEIRAIIAGDIDQPVAPDMFKVTFDADNGTAASEVYVEDGSTVTKPATDPVKAGYTFLGWFNGDAEYEFTAPVKGALTLTAHWEALPTNEIVIDTVVNGTVTATPSAAAEGVEVTLTITPADNYELDTVTVTGATVGAVTVTENKFTMPAEAVTVTVTFKEKVVVPPTPTMYSVTFDADNGTTPAVVEVEENTAVAAPAVNPEKEGFTFLGWFAPEAAVAYDFATLVTANLTLTAHWEEAGVPTTYAVTVVPTENGTASAPATAAEDEEVTVTYEANEGFELDEITVTGETVGSVAVTDNKFTMPAEAVTVEVTFKAVQSGEPDPEPEPDPAP